jgi:hypothetical protein
MGTFSVDFLGCKVSQTDAHAVRERLLADGHTQGSAGDVAVLNTCCVTNEAVAKSRKAATRLARTHRRVYVTGCGASLVGNLPENVVAVVRHSEQTPAAVAADLGALGCVQADARLDRVAFVKLGAEDTVLVDRPGRGYGDDYTPWLVQGGVGDLVRVRAGAVSEEGLVAA